VIDMKFEIDLTEEEQDELMKRFGRDGADSDVSSAVKKMILAVSKFREIYGLPEVGWGRELYRDSPLSGEDVVVTIRGNGEVTLFKGKGEDMICRTILVINPDYLSASVKEDKSE